MDIGSITAAITSLKAAKDIAQAILELKSFSDVQTKVIELQGQILSAQSSALDAQSEQFELKKRVSELEQERARLIAWEQEKQRYALTEISSGIFVYVVKGEARGGEPVHWLCSNCFNKGQKSILQFEYASKEKKTYKCHSCGSEIRVGNPNWSPPSHQGPQGPHSWMGA